MVRSKSWNICWSTSAQGPLGLNLSMQVAASTGRYETLLRPPSVAAVQQHPTRFLSLATGGLFGNSTNRFRACGT